ncbi:MAG: hypothetical protein ACI4JV_11350 [Ruminiclostridium sp.]
MIKFKKAIQKVSAIVLAVVTLSVYTIVAQAEINCVNINHTGGYQCDQNTEAFITITKEKIGTMAYCYSNSVYIRATTTTGGITSQGFTASLSNPKRCDRNGYFTNGVVSGKIVLKGDVSKYTVSTGWFSSTEYIRITNTNSKDQGSNQTFTKRYSDHYA